MKKNIAIKPTRPKVIRMDNFTEKEHLLNDSEKNLRVIMDNTPDVFVLFDRNLKVITGNKTFAGIIRKISGESPEKNFDIFRNAIRPERKKIVKGYFENVLKGKVIEYDTSFNIPDEKWFHIIAHPVKDSSGKINSICVTARDITRQKKNEQKLLFDKTLLDNLHVAVISLSNDLKITGFNKAAELLYSVPASKVIGRPLTELKHEFITTSFEEAKKIFEVTGHWEGEAVFHEKDGKKILVHINANNVCDKDNNEIGIVAVNTDITAQREMEVKNRRSEEHMKSILESTPEALLLINLSYDIISFNPRANIIISKFIKLFIEEGMNLVEILPDFRKDDARQKLDYASLGNFIEYEVQYPDGSWLLVSVSPVKNSEGKVTEICVGLRDISRRKNVEHMLRKNDQQYRSLVDSLSEGVIFQSFDKRIITFNDSAIEILGVNKENLQRFGFPLPGCPAVDEKNQKLDIKEIIRNRVFEGFSVRGLIAGVENSGEIKWLSINIEPVRNEEGLAYAYVITFRDITAAFKNREELNLLSKVVKETSNIVVITDPDERIVWANDAFTRISEYTLQDALHKRPGWLLKGPEKDKKEIDRIKAAIKKQVPVQGNILNYTKTGKKYWSHYNIHPVHDENGKLIRFFSIQTDITESRKLQEEISLQKELRLRERSRATIKGQENERNEIGRELHDNIQQILGAAKLQLDCALSYKHNSKEYIRYGVENISLAIDEIRKFSKRLVAPRFQDNRLTDEINEQLINLGISNMATMDYKKFNETLPDHSTKLVLFRVIQEQLTNILKHAKASSVHIRLESDHAGLMLEVKDNGVGFDPSQKRNGIGLSNIYNRVELSGGSVKINSAEGKGCKLTVAIPLKNNNNHSD
ncbi:MAG: PAS domain S-box protein [Sphingobacteriales bacterium]|nr:PAS domain S-box protein [Sphingobacteriales bacterium]